ncbi:MAG TPA: asparagine synthase-related protein [Povalibacter sp.]|nr:asparagine synthase-related protein [Povalibacter sp.]
MQALVLRLSLPAAGPGGEYDNFFVGIWHPTRRVIVDWQGSGPVPVAAVHGHNWMLVSAVSPFHESGGLVHAAPDRSCGVAFRGYVCDPALHSYSPGDSLLRYWTGAAGEHNGVFSAAVIGEQGTTLTLVTDVLGFAPLYYRHFCGALIFSTNPRLLAATGDTPDLLAWRCLLEGGFIASERTLSSGICRVPAGKSLRASGDSIRLESWLALEDLPRGDRKLDEAGIAEVERSFQQAMDRCLGLQNLQALLPLSSGHDSRRMLAALVQRGSPFHALTARVFHKGRDLDARYAAEMARDFGVQHTIVEPADARQFAIQDKVRRLLTDAESGMHSWVPGLMRGLPASGTMVFDGIAGDILGNPGFRIPQLYRSPASDIEIILDVSVPNAFGHLLSPDSWPTAAQVREDLRSYLQTLPQRINLAEFAFILLRQRRATAPWSQQLLPPGHVPVCPFLDLDYIRLLLSFVPQDKHATILQRRCLAEFWPQFYRYPGTRDIPPDSVRRSARVDDEENLACLRALRAEIDSAGARQELSVLLSTYGRIAQRGSRLSRHVALRTGWQFQPLMELVARQVTRRDCWQRIA